MKPLISASALTKNLSNADWIIVDAGGSKRYENEHIKGALYVNLDRDLSDVGPDASKGGRHPLPSSEDFIQLLSKLGISPDHHVVIYDENGGANAAARMWWMLHSIGHTKVQVLDGGLQAAKNSGIVVTSEVIPPSPKEYPSRSWGAGILGIEDVDQILFDQSKLLIDVRSSERYAGKQEPIDLVAGHIPGAINAPFADNLDSDGTFKSPEALKSNFDRLTNGKSSDEVVFYCGSGVTACHGMLAWVQAGNPMPNLYVGSWSEWSRNNREIAP